MQCSSSHRARSAPFIMDHSYCHHVWPVVFWSGQEMGIQRDVRGCCRFGCSLISMAFLGHHVGDVDAFSGYTRLLPADSCGVFLGKPESDTAKNISRQLSPSWLYSHLSTICFDFASVVLHVNILLKCSGHRMFGTSSVQHEVWGAASCCCIKHGRCFPVP